MLGTRRIGKITLARTYVRKFNKIHFFYLENLIDPSFLKKPMLSLMNLQSELIVIDKIQRWPELFSILRVFIDQNLGKFLILG